MTDFSYTQDFVELNKRYPDAYLANWSAAEYWGIIDELSRRVILFSPKTEGQGKLGNMSFYIKKVPQTMCFDIQKIDEDDGEFFYVSSPAKTMVDCFLYPELAGGERQTDYIFSMYYESPLYDQAHLLTIAKKLLPPEKISHILKLIQELKND